MANQLYRQKSMGIGIKEKRRHKYVPGTIIALGESGGMYTLFRPQRDRGALASVCDENNEPIQRYGPNPPTRLINNVINRGPYLFHIKQSRVPFLFNIILHETVRVAKALKNTLTPIVSILRN